MRRRSAVLVVLAARGSRSDWTGLRSRDRTQESKPPPPRQDAKATPAARPPAAEAGLLPWQLAAPLSREVVLPRAGTRHELVILGGLSSGGLSTNGVAVLDTRTGRLTPQGSLLQATHDAAGAALGARQLVIGGGTAAPAGGTQIVAGGKATRGAAPAGARADAGAVTIGKTVYVVGGYDGPALNPEVVSTTDGRSYRPVAALRVPVRYPALAVLGSRIYVFGGLAANGHPSDAVQLVDPANAHGASGRPATEAARRSVGRRARWHGLPRRRQHRGGADSRHLRLSAGQGRVPTRGIAASPHRQRRCRRERRPALDRRGRVEQRPAGIRRPDGRSEPGLREGRRPRRRLAVRRRPVADRGPRQRPAAPPE